MNRAELLQLRERLIMGVPPYQRDFNGTKRRSVGIPGIEELRAIGDYSPSATGVILALESTLQLVEHLLEKVRT